MRELAAWVKSSVRKEELFTCSLFSLAGGVPGGIVDLPMNGGHPDKRV
jgi:hypothetical protein